MGLQIVDLEQRFCRARTRRGGRPLDLFYVIQQ